MASEPDWLLPDEVAELNQIVVELTGEPYFLREPGLLESACFSARHHWLYDENAAIPELAALLLLALARNHPFEQGNKRTAFAAAREFLLRNGWDLDASVDSAEFADEIIRVVTRETPDTRLIEMFRTLSMHRA